jgi:ParB/RepB/Spo0J family partition protein
MSKVVVERTEVPIDQIIPSPYQPRQTFDIEDIKGSIMKDGILVPLTARKKDGYYELIDGERRWRVARELGYKTVPCTIIEADDESADRMIWKVNTLRKDYEPKEKALHFREHQKKGMSVRGIAESHDTSPNTVLAYLNVFKLPEEYQEMVWDRVIPIGVINALEPLFTGVTYVTPQRNPELFAILDRAAREKHFTQKEAQEAIKPYLTKLREEQIEKAKEVIEEIEPEVKKPETPEELERVAKALRIEAKKRREGALTPEQKARIEAEKKHRAEEKRKMLEERKRREEEELRKRLEAERKRIEEETRQKLMERVRKDVEAEVIKKVQEGELEVTVTPKEKREFRDMEISAKGPLKEIITEDVWECPICHVKCKLIHMEPRGHRLEEAL